MYMRHSLNNSLQLIAAKQRFQLYLLPLLEQIAYRLAPRQFDKTEVLEDELIKALHYYRCQSYWSVVVEVLDGVFLRHWDDGGCL